jgi:translocation and assembly module TamB
LRQPAPLAARPEQFTLGRASFALTDGTLEIESVKWSPGKLATRGSAKGLSVAYVQKLFPEATRAGDVRTTLTLGASWTLDLADDANGTVTIGREDGDLTLLGEPSIALGLKQLTLTAQIVHNRLDIAFDLSGEHTGVVAVRAQSVLAQRDGAWGLPGDAQLTVAATADVPSLAWTSLLRDPGYTVDGRARLRLSRTGTVRTPHVGGSMEADDLALRIADYGVSLREGTVRATFEESRIVLTDFRMRAESGGELTASGSLDLSSRLQGGLAEGGADVHADKLAILNHPDYQLTVSGDGKLALAGGKLAVTGEVRADRGLIQLPKSDRPSLGSDVVVIRKGEQRQPKAGARLLSIDMLLDLGRDFTLRGRGLDAQLRGSVRVKSAPPGLPIGTGTIRVVEGTYDAYGQHLSISRGVLGFAGPIDNPSLDILAVRKNLAVEPGVSIVGTALAPRLKLVSTPTVPDTEKLAWLVLGHGLEGSTRSDMDLLPVAAAALMSQSGASPTSGITHALGIDEIGIGTANTGSPYGSSSISGSSISSSSAATGNTLSEQRVLTVGKRISQQIYLTYEAGLDNATRVMRIQYDLTRRWSVRAEAGTRSALDLFYTVRLK